MDAQMKKGILEMCILYNISEDEMYGYNIMKNMAKYFPEVNESTFYAILRRLAREGLAEIRFGEESNGPKRKYYFITQKGKNSLKKSKEDWNRLNAIINDIGIV